VVVVVGAVVVVVVVEIVGAVDGVVAGTVAAVVEVLGGITVVVGDGGGAVDDGRGGHDNAPRSTATPACTPTAAAMSEGRRGRCHLPAIRQGGGSCRALVDEQRRRRVVHAFDAVASKPVPARSCGSD